METILKICILLLAEKYATAIVLGNEKPASKPSQQSENLPWFSNFGPSLPDDDNRKLARQINDPSLNSLCSSGVTGQFPYAPDCKRFINCWKGRGMIQVCGPGTLFNPESGECDYPDKVKCIQGNQYTAHPQSLPSRFPSGRPGIEDNQRISRKENYRTESVVLRPYPWRPPYFGPSHLTRPQPKPTPPTKSGSDDNVRCPPGGAGLYPHPTDCQKFLNCWGGRMFIQQCGPGTLFHPVNGICEHASKVECKQGLPEGDSELVPFIPPQENAEVVAESVDRGYNAGQSTRPADFYNPVINLYDVRTLRERTSEQENLGVTNPDTNAKKDRDPKILNWGNNRKSQPAENQLYYDAHGNPINPDQYWVEVGKPIHQNPHSPHKSEHHKPQNGPGDSNGYFLRPHNHVMTQNPPHLQTKSGVQHPDSQTFRPQNSHTGTGHYILVEDPSQRDTKLAYESHQNNNDPPTYLVPPKIEDSFSFSTANQDSILDLSRTNGEPSSWLLPPRPEETIRATTYHPIWDKSQPVHQPLHHPIDTHQQSVPNQEAPSRFLQPPRADEEAGSKPADHEVLINNPVKYDYGNWKPYYNDNDSSKVNSSDSERPFWEVHPVFNRWNSTSNSNSESLDTAIDGWNNGVQSEAVSTTTESWSKFYGYKNPYGIHRTSTTTRIPTSTTLSPKKEETSTDRVYVVYPVKTEEVSVSPVYVSENKHKHGESVKVVIPGEKQKLDDEERIKPEVNLGDSEEDLNIRDVEMYSPTIEELLPNAGKNIRLKPLSNHLDGYIEVKGPDGEWGLVCDEDSGWMISEANVICKELGYGRGAQISWQGYPLDSSTESIPVAASEVICNGNEDSFFDCRVIYGDLGCDITKNAIGLRCFDNVTTQCHPEEVEYDNNCYRLVKRDNLDDEGFSLDEAADYCKTIGGRIADVTSEAENDFISEWLMHKHPDVRTVLTGGIGSAVMGRPLWMWFGSEAPMGYQKWWKGWAGENKVEQGSVYGPKCVVLRKSFPCFIQDSNDASAAIELGNLEPEYCSANYFYWDIEDCNKLNEMNLPHMCKKPLEEIGCVVGRGEDYSGTESITSSGLPCLPWDTPEVKEKLAHQITLQEWSTKLSGHNFCRNLGRQELHPWCFVAGKENSEYCSIPQCWDSVPGYSRSAGSKSCDETQFECKAGECIKREGFCNGKKECSNGRDEAMCNIFLQEFAKTINKRMKGHGREKWPDVNDNTCAKLCLESKKFKCKSFSFHAKKKTCLLSDTNVGLSGQVISEEGWNYYELSVGSLNCTTDRGLMKCGNGKCFNMSNICDGKDNCGDGSDEVNCKRLGYQIRLAGSNETNRGRVEVKILGKWGTICDDKFDLRDGEVVCRELGFKHGVAEILPNSQYPVENPLFVIDELDCLGNESSIRECSFPGWGEHDCKPEETVGVVCRVPDTKCPDDQWHCSMSKECIPITYLCDAVPDCDDKSDEDEKICNKPIKVRLAGGPNATTGRLEVEHFGTWGTICDDGFNEKAASVVCRILGYKGPSTVLKNAHFGPGKGPIWLDGIHCYGNETNVDECTHTMWGKHNCKHDEDVSISCSELTVQQKSSSVKPIAHSADIKAEEHPMEKLREVLLQACSEDVNVSLHSLGDMQKERVVGSDVVRDGIPWQASIRVRSPGGKSSHWCGAVIISPYHILTAGHCLRDYSKPAYFIRVGDFDTEVEDAEEQEYRIDHLYSHPQFNHKLHLNNDIALVKVKGEIRFGDRVRPACLAPSTDIYQPGTNCSISGWGSVSSASSGYARTLRRAYIPILEPSVCKAPFVYGDNLSEGMFCAGKLDGGVDSCQGDSGGPIICEFEGKQYLFGITSWGHGCGRANKPGVYTNVAHYSDWIQEKIELSLM